MSLNFGAKKSSGLNFGSAKKKSSGDDGFLGTGIGPSVSGTLNDLYHGTVDTVEAVPKAAAGLITGATSAAYHGFYGTYAAAGAGISNLLGKDPSGYWRAADENLAQAGEFPVGMVKSFSGTLGDIMNAPANLTGNAVPRVGDSFDKAVGRGLAQAGGQAAAMEGDIPDTAASKRVVDYMGEHDPEFRPQTFSEKQKQEGTGLAVLETVGNLALLGKGVKGIGDATSTVAEGSHPGVADVGERISRVGERMEKPLKGVGKATVTPLIRAALEARTNAGDVIVPEQVGAPENVAPGAPAASPGAPQVPTAEGVQVLPDENAPLAAQAAAHGAQEGAALPEAQRIAEAAQGAAERAQEEASRPKGYVPTPDHPDAAPAHSAAEQPGARPVGIGTPEKVGTGDLAGEVRSAQAESKVRELSPTAEEFAQRQAKPVPEWARKVVEHAPERVTKVLSGMERFAQRRTAGIIATELKRAGIEVPRSQDLHDPFIQAAIKATDVMREQNPKMTIDDVSRFVGDALHGRIAGLGEHGILKPEIDAALEAGDAKLARSLRDRGHQHIMPEEARTPELDAALADAHAKYREWAETTKKGYESSTTHGPRGLEDANATEPTANKNIERLQKRIDSLRARAERLGHKVPLEVQRLEKQLAELRHKSEQIGERVKERSSLRNAAAERLAEIANARPPAPKAPGDEGKLPGMGDAPKLPGARTARQIARAARAVEGETPNTGVQRGVTVGFTAEDISRAGEIIAKDIKTKDATDAAIKDLEEKIGNRDTRSAALSEKAKLMADKAQEKLTQALDKQPVSQWPRRLQPAGRAYVAMLKEAEDNPALAALVKDAEPTFRSFMHRAVSLGMDPQYVADLTEAKVHELSAERVPTRMGRLMVSGARKEYTGNLAKMDAVDRSVEAFMAARTAMHQEITTNVGTEYWKRNFAIKVPKGTTFDHKGDYAAWDPSTPMGHANNVARETSGVSRFTSDGYLVPKSLLTAIKRSEQDFSTGWQGANKYVMNPWRNAVITASPQFYINHTLGHAVLATIEGVRLGDWVKAWQAYKAAKLNPLVSNEYTDFTGHSIVNQGTTHEPSMIDAGTIRERAGRAEGAGATVGAATHGLAAKLHNVTNVVDGITRAAVYISKRDKGYTDGEALQRAYSSVVDYNDLSPAEQQVARAIIPFYSFQKAILKIVAKFPVDHPVVLGIGAALGRINAQQMQDQFGTTMPLGYQGLIPNGGGAIQTRGLNPFKDSFSLASPDGIAAALNPVVAGAARIGLHAPSGGYVSKRTMDSYGNTVPDVGPGDVGMDVTSQLPFVTEAEALAGAGKGPVRGTARAFGLNTYDPAEIKKLVERIKGSKNAVKNNSPFSSGKKSSGSGLRFGG